MGRNRGQARRSTLRNSSRPPAMGITKMTRVRTLKLFPESLQAALVKIGCSNLQKLWRMYRDDTERIERLLTRHVQLPRTDGTDQVQRPDHTQIAAIRVLLTTRRLPSETPSHHVSQPPLSAATAAE